jgi:hypothetical protein
MTELTRQFNAAYVKQVCLLSVDKFEWSDEEVAKAQAGDETVVLYTIEAADELRLEGWGPVWEMYIINTKSLSIARYGPASGRVYTSERHLKLHELAVRISEPRRPGYDLRVALHGSITPHMPFKITVGGTERVRYTSLGLEVCLDLTRALLGWYDYHGQRYVHPANIVGVKSWAEIDEHARLYADCDTRALTWCKMWGGIVMRVIDGADILTLTATLTATQRKRKW